MYSILMITGSSDISFPSTASCSKAIVLILLPPLRQGFHRLTKIPAPPMKHWVEVGGFFVSMSLNLEIPAPQSSRKAGEFGILKIFRHYYIYELLFVVNDEP